MQLQSFKQIGSDQSYRLTIWGRMVVFQTRAISGTRAEKELIIVLQSVWTCVHLYLCLCVY